MKNIYVGSNKENVKTVIGNSSNSHSLGKRANLVGFPPTNTEQINKTMLPMKEKIINVSKMGVSK